MRLLCRSHLPTHPPRARCRCWSLLRLGDAGNTFEVNSVFLQFQLFFIPAAIVLLFNFILYTILWRGVAGTAISGTFRRRLVLYMLAYIITVVPPLVHLVMQVSKQAPCSTV